MKPMLDEQISAPSRHVELLPCMNSYSSTESRTSRKPLAAATQRLALWASRNFFAWASTALCVGSNPFKDVKPVGKVSAGKPQLRIEEARRFTQTAQELFEESGHALPIGALVALMMGLRTQEVLLREVRDLDVPLVCTHSPRGLHATLAVQSGSAAHVVAASLGHSSFEMTQRHYAQASSVANAATARVLHILDASHAKGEAQAEVIAEALRAQLERPILLRLAELIGQSEASSDPQIRPRQSIRRRSVGPNRSTDSVVRGDGEYLAG
jgi:hypothetical protein